MLSPPSFRLTLGYALLAVLTSCAPKAIIDCDLKMVARLPLEVEDHLLVVPAGINGAWVRLIVDTGAERTTITSATAERLGLPHDRQHAIRSLGVGGATTTNDAALDRLVLGGVHIPLNRIAVGSFTLQTRRGLNADGLLGADILLAFDVDIDVPGGKLTLYRSRRCPRARLPWHEPAVEITGVRARKDRLLMPFELDNVDGMAILDTGAQHNVLGRNMAHRLGLNSRTMSDDPTIRAHGVGPAAVTAHLHSFNLLRIGPIVQQPAPVTVMDSDMGDSDALIGEEFLFGRRVWLSFKSRQIFVSQPRHQ